MKIYDYVMKNEGFYSKLVKIKDYYDFIDPTENRLEIGNYLLHKYRLSENKNKLKDLIERFNDELNLIEVNKDNLSYDFPKFKEIFDRKIVEEEFSSFSNLYKIYIQLLLLDLSISFKTELKIEGCSNPSIKHAYIIKNYPKKLYYMKTNYFTFDIVKPYLNTYKEVLEVENLYMKITRDSIDKTFLV